MTDSLTISQTLQSQSRNLALLIDGHNGPTTEKTTAHMNVRLSLTRLLSRGP